MHWRGKAENVQLRNSRQWHGGANHWDQNKCAPISTVCFSHLDRDHFVVGLDINWVDGWSNGMLLTSKLVWRASQDKRKLHISNSLVTTGLSELRLAMTVTITPTWHCHSLRLDYIPSLEWALMIGCEYGSDWLIWHQSGLWLADGDTHQMIISPAHYWGSRANIEDGF